MAASFCTVFFQMLSLLIMIGAGFFLTKKGMLDAHTNAQMSQMIVTVFNPLLIISSAESAVGHISKQTLLTVALIALGMFLCFIVAGMILTPLFEKDRQKRPLFQMLFVFSNLGFIGIPVVSTVLGAEYVVYVTEFILIYTLVFYSYGVALMDGAFSLHSLKAMANPGMAAGIAALLIALFDIRLPAFVNTAVTYLANITSPMALVAVGFSLAHADLRRIFSSGRMYAFAAIKLVAIPLALLPLLRLVTDDRALVAVCLVMFGMPVGNMPLILATERGLDGSTCSAVIILTTLLCVVTIPLLLMIAG